MADTFGATLLPVRLASTANVTVGTGVTVPATIDSVAPVAGDRILLAGQTTLHQNGIYTVSANGGVTGNITRSTDFAFSDQMVPGVRLAIREGKAFQNSEWMLANDTPPVVGTDTLHWARTHPHEPFQWLDTWAPSAAKWQSIPRGFPSMVATLTAQASGTMHVFGGLTIPSMQQVDNFIFTAGGTAGASLTQSWVEIIRVSDRLVLAASASITTATWSANGTRTFTISPAYVNNTGRNLPVYVGLVIVGTTRPTLRGFTLDTTYIGTAPIFCGTSNTGLTTPSGRVGATATAVTVNANYPGFWVY